MRTKLDLPDAVFRALKARAVLEGLPLRDLIVRYVTRGLADDYRPTERGAPGVFVSAHDLMSDGCGMVDSGIPDLATNPKHMDRFGLD